jgi:hypothetical protein
LEYDEETESMAQTIIIMSPPPKPPESIVNVPRDALVTRPSRGVEPGEAAIALALYN